MSLDHVNSQFKFFYTKPDGGQWIKLVDEINSWHDRGDAVASDVRNHVRDALVMYYAATKAPKAPSKSAIENELSVLRDTHHLDRDAFTYPRDLVHFQNGVYLLETREFVSRGARWQQPSFTSQRLLKGVDVLTFTVIPHDYMGIEHGADPALIKEFNDWLGTLLGTQDQIQTWWEWLGYCLTNDTSFKRAMLFHGPTNCGKTVFADYMTWILGEENVAAMTLDYITKKPEEAFNALEGKKMNTHDEMQKTLLRNIGAFKILTSGKERLGSRPLYSKPYDVRLTCKLVCNGNSIPHVTELDEPFAGRWLILFFKNQFNGDEKIGGFIDRFKDEALASWVIHVALEAYYLLRARGDFVGMSPQQIITWWREETDPVYKFVSTECVVDPLLQFNQCTEKKEVYEYFVQWCETNGIIGDRGKPITPTSFTQSMITLGHPTRKTEDYSGAFRVYAGIKLKPDAMDELNENTFDIEAIKGGPAPITPHKAQILVYQVLRGYEIGVHRGCEWPTLLERCEAKGLTRTQTERALERLMGDSQVIRRKDGLIMTVQKDIISYGGATS